MAKSNSFLRIMTSNDFESFLLSLGQQENSQREFLFSSAMLDSFCKKEGHVAYRFAHNLEGHFYMRMRIGNITLEYLANLAAGQKDFNAYVHQVFISGKRIYRRPTVPTELVHIQWSDTN